jgi:hypothetical protein
LNILVFILFYFLKDASKTTKLYDFFCKAGWIEDHEATTEKEHDIELAAPTNDPQNMATANGVLSIQNASEN